jgi:hypothetical protein
MLSEDLSPLQQLLTSCQTPYYSGLQLPGGHLVMAKSQSGFRPYLDSPFSSPNYRLFCFCLMAFIYPKYLIGWLNKWLWVQRINQDTISHNTGVLGAKA